MKKKSSAALLLLILVLIGFVASRFLTSEDKREYSPTVADVPAFSGQAYAVINDNQPEFTDSDYTTDSYEYFSELDSLNRCGYTMACIGYDLMPTEDRESIGQVKPSGWQTVKYDFVDGKYLYNRCHLIGFQLTGENANERNLITGTRFMNTQGMLPFENMVADYVKETGNHVLYRVTPIFKDDELVARGVQMEGWSVEDSGAGICFNVYVYNNQPGVEIDYATGESWEVPTQDGQSGDAQTYVLNTSSKKFHMESCANGQNISPSNQDTFTGSRGLLVQNGYTPAGCCDP